MSEWIKCSERFPDSDGRYLVFEKKEPHFHKALAWNWKHPCCCKPNIAYYSSCNGWEWDTNCETKLTPTHWMELPKPPIYVKEENR